MKIVLLLVVILLISMKSIICFKYQHRIIHNHHHHIVNNHHSTKLKVLVNDERPSLVIDQEFPNIVSKFNEKLVLTVKSLLILLYNEDNIYARFAALETIARVPYFAYISCLHLKETLGQRGKMKNLAKLHFDETENEQIHLLIMEELGGNKEFSHRFYSQHIAVIYYWIVIVIYLINPSACYDLNYHVEKHAFQTYDGHLNKNADILKNLPVPEVAKEYYDSLNKPVDTLYDVFVNIRDDELEHSAMMFKLRDDFMKIQQD